MPKINLFEHIRRGSAFLAVGLLAFAVDLIVFNALAYWGGQGPLFHAPLLAKIISIAVASLATYVGNRLWTFRDRQTRTSTKQIVVFVGLNLIAILIQLACLWFSRYVLGLSNPIADNVSGTLVGQTLATLFRYFTYGRWVFPPLPGITPERNISSTAMAPDSPR